MLGWFRYNNARLYLFWFWWFYKGNCRRGGCGTSHWSIGRSIIKYKRGSQIIADSIIKEGIVEVNESLISGEENSITKKEGDILYSGSFIISGNCICRVERVGDDNYSAKITNEAKYVKKVNSEIMRTLNKVIKVMSIIIVPIGVIIKVIYEDINDYLF